MLDCKVQIDLERQRPIMQEVDLITAFIVLLMAYGNVLNHASDSVLTLPAAYNPRYRVSSAYRSGSKRADGSQTRSDRNLIRDMGAPTPGRLLLALACACAVLHAATAGAAHETARQKTCAEAAFCVRQAAAATLHDAHPAAVGGAHAVEHGSLRVDVHRGQLYARLVHRGARDAPCLDFAATVLAGGAMRVEVRECGSPRRAFELPHDVLFAIPEPLPVRSFDGKPRFDANSSVVEADFMAAYTLVVWLSPFKFEVREKSDEKVVLAFNERSYLHYEHLRSRNESVIDYHSNIRREQFIVNVEHEGGGTASSNQNDENDDLEELLKRLNHGMWEEEFDGFIDSKPNGPTSVGFDLTFHGASHLYGLPEHAGPFSLKDTVQNLRDHFTNPYRLYNLDVPVYGLEAPMLGLYGSIAFALAHSERRSTGVLWLNPSEMYVDVAREDNRIFTHWIAESGVLDALIFLGPTPRAVSEQLTRYVGRPALPQRFATGYHQCRYSYMSETEVAEIDAGFNEHEIPYDVLWLDIDHSDGFQWFTWDPERFKDPVGMQHSLAKKGRKMVTIIDPHIKVDDRYQVYHEAKQLDLFVKKPNGVDDGVGDCWPGDSVWIDFVNPDARNFWSDQFSFEKYNKSTPTLYTWNDMNEPSFFTGPEITIPKDFRHLGAAVEHRDIHNAYGRLQQSATHAGHLLRSNGTDRPFVLSRSFFTGTQRYGAVWTGDNSATWGHLQASIAMILSVGISGITFVGADVGGFIGDTEPELFTRWMQAAAFQPFYRGHAVSGSKMREPWRFGEPYTTLNRAAIRERYIIAPYLYTLFWESHMTGAPILRPMMWEFPNDVRTFDIDNAAMLGSALLVHPVVHAGAQAVEVYLPPSHIWYDYATFDVMAQSSGQGKFSVPTPFDKIPVFIKGGSILVQRETNCSSLALCDGMPYSLIVALDEMGSATGTLYSDDGHSFQHQTDGKYLILDYSFASGTLESSSSRRTHRNPAEHQGHASAKQDFGAVPVEGITFVGVLGSPRAVIVDGRQRDGVTMDVHDIGADAVAVTVRGLAPYLRAGDHWRVQLVA
ncbi:hypothetical protein HDU83_000327 [Entophlyctis luteolus]|nr:hypothetical protein HDU83_000327 [Entophlyctis luteolus]